MQKRTLFRRTAVRAFALLAAAWIVGSPAHPAVDSCLIPPAGSAPAARDLWLRLSMQARERVLARSAARPLAATVPQLPPSSVGRVDALVLLVDFPDVQAQRPNLVMRNLFFGSPLESPVGSVSQYMAENSYGKLDFGGIAFGDPRPFSEDNPDPSQQVKWIRVPRPYSYYAGGAFGFGPDPRNSKQLVRDALTEVRSLYPNFNWRTFDKNGDGFIDLLYVVHAGAGAEGTTDPTTIWSHRGDLDDFEFIPASATQPALLARSYAMGAEDGSVGVHAHESLHVFGLPDLYTNPQGQSVGLGNWSMMASGSNIPLPDFTGAVPFEFALSRPAHLDPWSKIQLGWLTPTVIAKSTAGVSLPPVQISPSALKIPANPNDAREYYLVEYRPALEGTYDGPITFDTTTSTGEALTLTIGGLPGSGVLIYHIDERRGTNDDKGHLLSRIEEADIANTDAETGLLKGYGLLHSTSHPLSNYGEPTDTFGTAKTEFGPATRPSSLNYDGEESGIRIANIKAPAPESIDLTDGSKGLIVRRANAGEATMDITVASVLGTVFTSTGVRQPAYTIRVFDGTGKLIENPNLTINGARFTIADLDLGNYVFEIAANGYIPQTYAFTKGAAPVAARVFILPQPSASSVLTGWNLISLPFDFGGAKVTEALGKADLPVYAWDGTNYVADPVAVVGQAYWVYLAAPADFKIALAGRIVPPEVERSIPIKKGWNLIGNPYPRGIVWNPSVITIRNAQGRLITLDEANETGQARNFAWRYIGGTVGYRAIKRGDPIPTMTGFWYRSEIDGELVLPAPAPTL